MKKIEILNNRNRVYSEVTRSTQHKNQTDDFSIRAVFTGSEQYAIGSRHITNSPGTFLVINEASMFDREVYSDIPVQCLSVFYTADFLRSFHHSYTASDKTLLNDPFNVPKGPAPTFLETLYPFKGDMKFNLSHLKNLLYSYTHDDLLLSEYLNHCLINFYKVYNKEILQKSEQLNVLNNQTRTELFKRLNNAKDYMLSNYANMPASPKLIFSGRLSGCFIARLTNILYS
jgi:AraC family transcriptional regulator